MSDVEAGTGADAAATPDAAVATDTSAPGPAPVEATARGAGFLTAVRLIAGRELGACFDGKIAYVSTIAFVVLANSIFMNEFFLTGTVDMSGYFELMPLLLPFFLPAVTMRLWAEERKTRTLELLMTLPVRPSAAVLGKFLAALGLYALFLLGSLPIVAMLFSLGDPDPGLIVAGYLGLLLLGSFLLALGTFLSSLVSDQIVAFVTAAVVGSAFVLLGNDSVVAVLDGLFPERAIGTWLLEHVSVRPHFEAFVRGVVPASGVIWLLGGTSVFLWLTATTLRRHRD